MSKSKNDELYRMHAIRGYRLARAMERNTIKQAELLRQAKELSKNYFSMSAQTLNMIIHGKRPLRYEDAEVFAEILGVTPGYLMGSEDSEETKQILAWEKEAHKYRALLNRINANIVALQGDGDEADSKSLESYIVAYETCSSDNEPAKDYISVSIDNMESFYQDVCSFIRKRFDILVDLSDKEA